MALNPNITVFTSIGGYQDVNFFFIGVLGGLAQVEVAGFLNSLVDMSAPKASRSIKEGDLLLCTSYNATVETSMYFVEYTGEDYTVDKVTSLGRVTGEFVNDFPWGTKGIRTTFDVTFKGTTSELTHDILDLTDTDVFITTIKKLSLGNHAVGSTFNSGTESSCFRSPIPSAAPLQNTIVSTTAFYLPA